MNAFKFNGKGSEFFGIWIVNVLLSIITLGIYSAWAKVRTNKYFYGNTELAGETFDYHATPGKILIGRLIAMVCVFIWAFSAAISPEFQAALLVAFVLVMPALMFMNTRFDARMTSYRHIRFNFEGSIWGFYLLVLGFPLAAFAVFIGIGALAGLVIGESMGLLVLVPIYAVGGIFGFSWWRFKLDNFLANGYRYGTLKFKAEPSYKAYLATFSLASLIAIGAIAVPFIFVIVIGFSSMLASLGDLDESMMILLGAFGVFGAFAAYILMFVIGQLINAFINVRIRNHLFSQTILDHESQPRLKSTMTVSGYLGLVITNFLLLIVSFGIARAHVKVRTAIFLADHTEVEGDLSAVIAYGESEYQDSAICDEMAAAFDLEVGL
ncbi:YjgN family protein [Thaumasiovibrio subtropicus]|uniref:YjgN family protein n=1 Tax=Thaumasiovibrio subtropicus TaxID=1891207 RepID=UPI00131CD7E6|nr:YjgN family protein [Thaumasiovibrio subtropicus]